MKTQKTIATIMIVAGSVLIAAVFRDIAFPAILCILGLLGLQRRFIWDIRPERRFITSLLLLLLTVLFALHYSYAGLRGRATHESISIVAWETIARYFLASMILILFLGSPHRLPPSLALFYMATVIAVGQVLLLDDFYMPFRLLEVLSVVLVVLYAAAGRPSESLMVQDGHRGPRRPLFRIPRASCCRVSPNAGMSDSTQNARSHEREHGALWSHRGAMSGLILLVALNLGWIASTVLYRHVELLNYVPVWLWQGRVGLEAMADGTAHVGFSDSGELSSVLLMKGDQDTTPVLRIMSDTRPGYLRARAFEVYRPSKWIDVSPRDPVFPAQSTPLGGYMVGRMNLFRVSGRSDTKAKEMLVRHAAPVPDALFTPLGVLSVEAPLTLLMHDDDDILYPPNPRASLNYRVSYSDSLYASGPRDMQAHRTLSVPAELDSRMYGLADRIFAGCTTTAEKAQAVIGYFQANYTYALGLSIPPGRDKLMYFLFEASTGYCEYFASGAAILLRLADVPTRYVTGFLVTEKDGDGEAWVARNMDAHAWVEAWDEENRQWMIVEATVQDGLATSLGDDESDRAGSGSGYLLLSLLLDNLYEYGLFGVLAWTLQYYGLPAVSFLLALALGLAFCRLYRRVWPRRSGRSAATISAELMALQRILARMDRRVRAAGARRHPSETLHAFAQRLGAQDAGDGSWTAASDWYVQYADLRYGRTILPNRLDELTRRIARPSRHKVR